MKIQRLRVSDLRCVASLDIVPGERLNLFWGPNGSGKTTILEALSILASGRSFRGARGNDLISRGKHFFALRADVVKEGVPEAFAIRFSKSAEQTRIELDGSPISSASVLARALPLLLVEPASFGIVEGAPKLRRAMIDRAVFHVEPEFLETSRRYGYALSQRNRLLKSKSRPSELLFWSDQLASAGQVIDASRRRCIDHLNHVLADDRLLSERMGAIQLDYRSGWPAGLSLDEALERNLSHQFSAGATPYGPHKGELLIKAADEALARFASRGQVKTVVISLVTKLARYLAESLGVTPVLLIDDFAAELDNAMRGLAFTMLAETQSQVFLTSIENPGFSDQAAVTAFHVERGTVTSTH
ncbi:MAG: DNA replication/repair protein RecF [Gammaproteobacteria bacterium]